MEEQKHLEKYKCIIQAGYIVISQEPSLLCSVCGSGVIVAVWDGKNKTGGLAHCLYPKPKWRERATNYHASVALPLLLKKMKNISDIGEFKVHLFGGGNKEKSIEKRANKTIQEIKKILKKLNIPVVSEDTGGIFGRKIIFNTSSGEILILKTEKIRKNDWTQENLN